MQMDQKSKNKIIKTDHQIGLKMQYDHYKTIILV